MKPVLKSIMLGEAPDPRRVSSRPARVRLGQLWKAALLHSVVQGAKSAGMLQPAHPLDTILNVTKILKDVARSPELTAELKKAMSGMS